MDTVAYIHREVTRRSVVTRNFSLHPLDVRRAQPTPNSLTSLAKPGLSQQHPQPQKRLDCRQLQWHSPHDTISYSFPVRSADTFDRGLYISICLPDASRRLLHACQILYDLANPHRSRVDAALSQAGRSMMQSAVLLSN